MWLSPAGGTLTPLNTAMLIGATAGAAVGYYAITSAMRLGDVSMVAPFRYSRLVFALVIGILLFGERPDAWTLIGAAIVIVSGIYVFARERQLARRAAH
jgi:drug/metabolite transporter (DMT)-like permease